MNWIIFSSLLFAQEPNKTEEPIADIVVEASKDYEVFIAPVQYHINAHNVSVSIPHNMVFNYAGMHSRSAKVFNGTIYEPITMHGGMKVYNADTIKYVWGDCDYSEDYASCSGENSHYFVETHITVTEEEVVVGMTLFNSEFQPISTSSRSSKKIINWIKQQEVIVTQQQGMFGSTTTVHKPKEEMPLKWEIPPRLFSQMIYQASIGLWAGVKLD